MRLLQGVDPQHHLLHVLFVASQHKNSSSSFHFYLHALPEWPSHALYYTESQIAAMEGSRAHSHILEVQSLFDAEAGFISKVFPGLFEAIGGIEVLRWAFAIVSSRAFKIRLQGDPERVMVPGIDMFNHMPITKAAVFFNATADCVQLHTDRNWAVDDEVFINYGLNLWSQP